MTVPRKSKIYFFFEKPVYLPNRTKLKQFIETIFRKEKRKLQRLNYVFCADKQLLDINRQYLNHNYYTDIITFELSHKGVPIEGEIYISVDRVKANAILLKQTFFDELHRVIFHGALHLCGYNDKNKKDISKMREVEDYLIKKYH